MELANPIVVLVLEIIALKRVLDFNFIHFQKFQPALFCKDKTQIGCAIACKLVNI